MEFSTKDILAAYLSAVITDYKEIMEHLHDTKSTLSVDNFIDKVEKGESFVFDDKTYKIVRLHKLFLPYVLKYESDKKYIDLNYLYFNQIAIISKMLIAVFGEDLMNEMINEFITMTKVTYE